MLAPEFPPHLALLNGKIYADDTNSHQIRIFDLAANRVSTLEIGGKKGPASKGCELCGVRVADTGIFARVRDKSGQKI